MASTAGPATHRNRFRRYEFKYLVRNRDYREFEASISQFMTPDAFAASRPGNTYFIRSLYFDTNSYDCYFEKVTGVKYRKKFRIRTYALADDGDVPIFLEIKGRDNNFVFKERQRISRSQADQVCRGTGLPSRLESDSASSGKVYEGFLYDVFKLGIRPRLIIDYERKPFVSKYDYEFRITLDRDISAISARVIHPKHSRAKVAIKPGHTVVEIKFRRSVPYWFTDVVRRYQLGRVSISKYCEGVEALGLSDTE